jgi:hypothetical protein
MWLAFIDNYKPPEPSIAVRYADDVSCFWPVLKSKNSNIVSAESAVQCVKYGLQWSQTNHMTLNTGKTKAMCLSLSNNTVMEPVSVDGDIIEYVEEFKFLGVWIDKRLSFTKHCETTVKKANTRVFFLQKLKRLGVNTAKLKLFYIANVRSVITYAIPAIHGHLTNGQLDSLERIQRFASRIMLPDIDSYTERLSSLRLTIVREHLLSLTTKYVNRVKGKNITMILKCLPEKQSKFRHSSRNKDIYRHKYRTELRRNACLVKYF